jgi:hypothetical protein
MKSDRAAHLSLVEQIEPTMHRQPWPMPEAKTFAGCSGACDGGIRFTPEACQLPEYPLPLQTWRPVFLALLGFWIVVGLSIWWMKS